MNQQFFIYFFEHLKIFYKTFYLNFFPKKVQVQECKNKLIATETTNGIKQVSMKQDIVQAEAPAVIEVKKVSPEKELKKEKPKKEKKEEKKPISNDGGTSDNVHVGRLDVST